MLDEKDRTIVACLEEDARLPIREIAKRTGLRPSTVHQRMGKLKAQGTIQQYTIVTRPEDVGEALIVFMLVKSTERIPSKALQRPEIKEVFGITGAYDLLLKLRFADVGAFNAFLISFRDEYPVETMTMVGTTTIKDRAYRPGQ